VNDTLAEQEHMRLFAANAETYDSVNTAVSLGLDARWRAWVARMAVTRPGAHVLDAFAGTGLAGLAAARLGAAVTFADGSREMLAIARHRAERRRLPVAIVETDLTGELPEFPGAPFDAVTVVFGVRYLDRPSDVLRRLTALLAPGGRLVLLEFADPSPRGFGRLPAFYFFHILPKIAGALSGDRELYRMLIGTTRRIRGASHLLYIVRAAGLEPVETRVMGFGLVVGIVAVPVA
jgi:demethylmenaquinone methyltransferase/2-methoxy-6-polyprenyl-1,4-benzoquinol methylase